MSQANQFVSGETLSLSRWKLNADGYKQETPIHPPFVTEEFKTSARTKDGYLFFGKILDKDKDQYELPAKAVFRWAQPRDDGNVIDAVFRWNIPQSGLVLCPVERELYAPVSADFASPVNALRVESFKNRTRVIFGNIAVSGSQVSVQPVDVCWRTDSYNQQLAQDLLVTNHLDVVSLGKIDRILDGRIKVVPQFSATL